MPQITLASSSPYRRELLKKTGLTFNYISPDIDEVPLGDENATDLVKRLSFQKAKVISVQQPDNIIIGSDQVLSIENKILGKPLTHEKAFQQLQFCSGKTARLLTGIAILYPGKNIEYIDIDVYEITYRNLQFHQIEHYLQNEKPYDCCGSLKAEGPGIKLLQRLKGNDPNSLIGLPIIKIVDFLLQNAPELLNNN